MIRNFRVLELEASMTGTKKEKNLLNCSLLGKKGKTSDISRQKGIALFTRQKLNGD